MDRGAIKPTEMPFVPVNQQMPYSSAEWGVSSLFPKSWGGGGQDRADRELRPEPTPTSHVHPLFFLPSLTGIVTRQPNHFQRGGGGSEPPPEWGGLQFSSRHKTPAAWAGGGGVREGWVGLGWVGLSRLENAADP